MSQEKFSLRKQIKSFSYAFEGLSVLLKEEHNARIHLVIALAVIVFGAVFGLTAIEWIFVVFSITTVLTAEGFNSAIENLSDYVSPNHASLIKKTKDLSAAAVLICAFGSAVVGAVIFLPKLF